MCEREGVCEGVCEDVCVCVRERGCVCEGVCVSLYDQKGYQINDQGQWVHQIFVFCV